MRYDPTRLLFKKLVEETRQKKIGVLQSKCLRKGMKQEELDQIKIESKTNLVQLEQKLEEWLASH